MATHTWLTSNEPGIYAYDIDLRVTEFTKPTNEDWLYFFALNINFGGGVEWAHGGLQHTGQFRRYDSLGVNWGGHVTGSGESIGHNIRPYRWLPNKWYRYRVWKVSPQSGIANKHGWLFAIMDYETQQEDRYGCVETLSEWITSASVFLEDGYGSEQCDCPTVRAEWRNPTYRTAAGTHTPSCAITGYNGRSCPPDRREDQGMIQNNAGLRHWYHALRVPNTLPTDSILW